MEIFIINNAGEAEKKIKENPNLGPSLMDRSREIGQPVIFDVILDISGSMYDFYDELVDCFNTIMIPSLREASKKRQQSMRLGCMLFSRALLPAWEGYKTLDQLGEAPLEISMLKQPGLQATTLLYGAMRSGILWTAASMKYMREKGRGEVPTGKIIVLTDGANNLEPHDGKVVKQTLSGIKNITPVVGFFNTDHGLTEREFGEMTKETGFEGIGYYDLTKGGTIEERRASFRHYFKIFSSAAAL